MKIAALLPHLEIYGGVRRYLEMGNEFTRRGHDYVIYHSDGAPCTWTPYLGRTAPISEATRGETDVCFCGDTGQLPLLADVPARLRILHVLGPRYAEKYRRDYRPDFLVIGLVSEWKNYLPGVPGITINGGVNAEVFRPVPVAKDPGVFTVIAFGRLRKEHKGTRDVLRGVQLLKDPSVRILLFDDREQPLPRFARKLNVEWVVDPPQESMAAMYCRADAFVSAELAAGWSNSTAEAMACGVPVVTTPSGACDFARDGETALSIGFHDPPGIARALARLRDDVALRTRLGEAGRREILQHTWPNVCDKLEAVFRERRIL